MRMCIADVSMMICELARKSDFIEIQLLDESRFEDASARIRIG